MNFFQIFGFGKNKAMRPQDFTSEEAKSAAAWLETVNPLRGMTSQRMQNLYDASRAGDTVHLQWLYHEIEQIDPTLLICQQRRTGALASLGWHISMRNKKRTRGFDETLAQEQADCLELAFGDAAQANFNDAVEHLARGFFRGFAHVLPRWSADGLSLKGFDCLDQWNFVRDISTGTWYWNPEAHAYTGYADCRPIPPGELVVFVAPYHIDYPAMTIYLRSAVGEKGWAKFVERFGIPPVILTMPQDIPSDQVDSWRRSAEKVAEGGSGAVPFGTNVNFCDGARGINPFKDFIHNQRELVVLMSTGGLLTSLAESGSGTLAGGAHSDTWAEVRRMDSAKIGSVLNRTLADTILDRAFSGRPHLAYFAFDTEAVPSPGEVFDDATKAKNAGYLIDKADLEERTGYKLVKDEVPAPQPAAPLFNKAGSEVEKKGGGGDNPPSTSTSSLDLLSAFAKDTGPAAEAVAKLLQDPSPEAAKALLDDLPALLPDDPELATVIAEAMAAEFADVIVRNKEDQPRGKTTEDTNAGSFAPADGGNGGTSDKAKAKAEKRQRQADNKATGIKAMSIVESGSDCREFMRSQKLGRIAFYQGNDSEGYLHIKSNPDPNHQVMLKDGNIPNTLAYGKYYTDTYQDKSGWSVVNGDKCVFLGKDGDGVKIITAYVSKSKAAVFARRAAIENKEV